ncbi:hypothetical protein P9578_22760 [Brevibacillus choshinensis]|uniref:hypothetical protein n=1 Tax=Brevibacillus choshinensis TaxID=54911 RepID=UPI002E212585|nr:hypothetical protein [Brevibacillus choshinensis]
MYASEIIGLAALLLVLIFFYTRIHFPKLRSMFTLILAFASAGLVGYSSASSIGIGWTVSLALLIFLGVAISVIFLQKREDRQIEQHFELALKSEQPQIVTPTQKSAAAPLPSPVLEVAVAPIGSAPVETLPIELQQDTYDVTDISVTDSEKLAVSRPAEQPDILMHALLEEVEVVNEASELFKGSEEAAPVQNEPILEPSVEAYVEEVHGDYIQAEAVQAEEAQVEAVQVHVHPEAQTPKVDNTILPEERNRIQTLSANAEQALQQGDYLRAYQSLREALTYNPPAMATYILSRQLVQVLNEMGLYEESISVLEKCLNETPSLSSKKQEEFTRQISYLEELIQQLQIENKRNLSWSLVPPSIHQKVIAHIRSLFASNNDHSTAIPFH